MMAFRALFFLVNSLPILLSESALKAAIIKSLDEINVIEFPVSKDSLTRIAVKDDRILHVVGGSDEYTLEVDETRGQIFIRPHVLVHDSKPIHLSLITEAGSTQDLCLIPQEKKPEALILTKETASQSNLLKENVSPASVAREEIKALLQACRDGRIPLKYNLVPVPFSPNTCGRATVPINILHAQGSARKTAYTLVRHLKGFSGEAGYLHGLTYEIKNTTDQSLVLSEEHFSKQFKSASQKPVSQILAILMPQKTIPPHEGAFIYAVVHSFK